MNDVYNILLWLSLKLVLSFDRLLQSFSVHGAE